MPENDSPKMAILFLKIKVKPNRQVDCKVEYSCSDPPAQRRGRLTDDAIRQTTHIISVPITSSGKRFVNLAYLPDDVNKDLINRLGILPPEDEEQPDQ